jgi:hypothetical protein
MMRRHVVGAAAWVFLVGGGPIAVSGGIAGASSDLRSRPAVLLLIEDPGCPYCRRWDSEVREGYEKSPEGRFAPLVRRFRGAADVTFIPNVVYSPTFIVLVRGVEVGRIVGYQGPELFWMQITDIMTKAGFTAASTG